MEDEGSAAQNGRRRKGMHELSRGMVDARRERGKRDGSRKKTEVDS